MNQLNGVDENDQMQKEINAQLVSYKAFRSESPTRGLSRCWFCSHIVKNMYSMKVVIG